MFSFWQQQNNLWQYILHLLFYWRHQVSHRFLPQLQRTWQWFYTVWKIPSLLIRTRWKSRWSHNKEPKGLSYLLKSCKIISDVFTKEVWYQNFPLEGFSCNRGIKYWYNISILLLTYPPTVQFDLESWCFKLIFFLYTILTKKAAHELC